MEPEEAREYVRTQAWEMIAPGLWDREDVLAQLAELAEYDDDMPLTGADTAPIVHELWEKRQQELADATEPGDHEAVIRAFQHLAGADVIIGFGLGFDRAEAQAECEAIIQDQGFGRGYVYFHGQDAARLAYPNTDLYLGFGAAGAFSSKDAYDRSAKVIGQEAVRACKAEGLNVIWNGSPDQRILLSGLNWRHPLPE